MRSALAAWRSQGRDSLPPLEQLPDSVVDVFFAMALEGSSPLAPATLRSYMCHALTGFATLYGSDPSPRILSAVTRRMATWSATRADHRIPLWFAEVAAAAIRARADGQLGLAAAVLCCFDLGCRAGDLLVCPTGTNPRRPTPLAAIASAHVPPDGQFIGAYVRLQLAPKLSTPVTRTISHSPTPESFPAVTWAAAHLIYAWRARLEEGASPDDPLFVMRPTGRPVTAADIASVLRTAVPEAYRRHVTAHCLRYSAATFLRYLAGWDPLRICEYVGWASRSSFNKYVRAEGLNRGHGEHLPLLARMPAAPPSPPSPGRAEDGDEDDGDDDERYAPADDDTNDGDSDHSAPDPDGSA